MRGTVVAAVAIFSAMAGGARAGDASAEADFVSRAAYGNLLAAAEARVARDRAADARVGAFARRVLTERGGDEAALAAAAEGSGAAVPAGLDPDRLRRLAALEALSGPAFDRAYLADQAEIFSNALTLYGDYVLLGDAPRLKALATRAIPAVQAAFTEVRALSLR